MKYAIFGAGAMGTILGAYLTKAGVDIDLISRNKKHIDGMKNHGAHVTGAIDFTQKVNAMYPSEMKDQYDIIFLMTKQLNNEEVVKGLVPFLSRDGVICTMQNGLPELSVSKVIGDDRTFGCAMAWGATMVGKGISKLTSEADYETLSFSLGSFGKPNEKKLSEIKMLLEHMGEVHIEENFIGARWAKLLVNSAFSGLSAILGTSFGDIAKNKKSRKIVQKIIKECIEVAHAANIKIEPIQGKNIEKLLDYNNSFKKFISYMIIPLAIKKHRNLKSSMLQDLEKGKSCEIESINGVVSEYGKQYNCETPINDQIIEIVKEIEKGKIKSSWDNLHFLKEFYL